MRVFQGAEGTGDVRREDDETSVALAGLHGAFGLDDPLDLAILAASIPLCLRDLELWVYHGLPSCKDEKSLLRSPGEEQSERFMDIMMHPLEAKVTDWDLGSHECIRMSPSPWLLSQDVPRGIRYTIAPKEPAFLLKSIKQLWISMDFHGS